MFLCVIILLILIFFGIIFLKEGLPEGLSKEIGMPYIKVISPNGGEKWITGQTYDIIWKSRGVERLTIVLCHGTEKEGYEGCLTEHLEGTPHGIDATLGKLAWQIDPSIVNYLSKDELEKAFIMIYSLEEWWISDKSDDFFSITQE